MKVAVTSNGNNLDSTVSQIFGRGSDLIFVDMEDGVIRNTEHVENPAKNERAGAGIKAAQYIANQQVKALISGSVGPNAFDILNQAGIKVYRLKPGTIGDNLKFLSEGQLEEITTPSSGSPGAGGRGMGRGGGMGRRR
jgi:predicted Fe-Mo cluster-binding NifX family protein